MHRRLSSKGADLRLDIPRDSPYASPMGSPQGQSVPFFASSRNVEAAHMKVPVATGGMMPVSIYCIYLLYANGQAGNTYNQSELSFASKYSLSPDPARWDAGMLGQQPEPDDDLHNPDPRRDRKSDAAGSVLTTRGIVNLGCLIVLVMGLLCLL